MKLLSAKLFYEMSPLRALYTPGSFPVILFTRETTFVTSSLNYCTPSPFWKGVYSYIYRKEFAPERSKFFPFRVGPFQKWIGRKCFPFREDPFSGKKQTNKKKKKKQKKKKKKKKSDGVVCIESVPKSPLVIVISKFSQEGQLIVNFRPISHSFPTLQYQIHLLWPLYY